MTPTEPVKMRLEPAKKLAERIAERLTCFCSKIEIAGSIRRRRPIVGDIDIVCIPKPGQRDAILRRCQENSTIGSCGEQYTVFELTNGFQLDLWFAHDGTDDLFAPQPSNWGMILLARTGSAYHNSWLADVAREKMLHFHPSKGLLRSGTVRASATEEEIFEALGMSYLPPERRER